MVNTDPGILSSEDKLLKKSTCIRQDVSSVSGRQPLSRKLATDHVLTSKLVSANNIQFKYNEKKVKFQIRV